MCGYLGCEPVSGMVCSGLGIIRHKYHCSTTEVPKHVDMCLNPTLHIHLWTSLCVGVHAIRQHTNKPTNKYTVFDSSVSRSTMYSLSPAQSTSMLFPGFRGMCMMARFFSVYCWEWRGNLEIHKRLLSGRAVFLAVLQLKEFRRKPVAVKFLGYPLIIWHPRVDIWTCFSGKSKTSNSVSIFPSTGHCSLASLARLGTVAIVFREPLKIRAMLRWLSPC